MASRSVQILFNNNTNSALTLQSATLQHGVWTQNDTPPATIAAGAQNVPFGSESDGTATGTQGTVVYQMGTVGTVTLNWDDPFSGSNSYSSSVPPGFACPFIGGDGNNANVTFTLSPVA